MHVGVLACEQQEFSAVEIDDQFWGRKMCCAQTRGLISVNTIMAHWKGGMLLPCIALNKLQSLRNRRRACGSLVVVIIESRDDGEHEILGAKTDYNQVGLAQ